MESGERCYRKQTPATYEAALTERELTFSYLGSTSAKANQVSGLTIGWAKKLYEL